MMPDPTDFLRPSRDDDDDASSILIYCELIFARSETFGCANERQPNDDSIHGTRRVGERWCRHGAAVRSSLSFRVLLRRRRRRRRRTACAPFTVARQKHRLAFPSPSLVFCVVFLYFNRKWCRVDACFLRVSFSRPSCSR